MSFACMEMHGSLHTVYADVVIKHLLLSILGEVLQVLARWHWDLQRHQGDADRDRAAVGVRHQDLCCREGTFFNLDQPKRDLKQHSRNAFQHRPPALHAPSAGSSSVLDLNLWPLSGLAEELMGVWRAVTKCSRRYVLKCLFAGGTSLKKA